MKARKLVSAVLLLSVCISTTLFAENKSEVPYPKDYRDWTRVKSMVIQEGHEFFNAFGGFHHVYANKKALVSLKKGTPFNKDSVLVFELFEPIEENHAITEGERKVIGVMVKDPKRYPETGGWGFEDFKKADPNQRSVSNMKEQCFSCHESQKANDYVYTRLHD
ncbi:MAG: cytochrome P460 family protein [Gammaproteobacteria bacterium]|nr:cytochrome P460 family protein [Gammaproteobacteria bacterium]